MKTLRNLTQLVDAHALVLIGAGRRGFREGDHAIDQADTELGDILLRAVLDRWCERVTAGQGA